MLAFKIVSAPELIPVVKKVSKAAMMGIQVERYMGHPTCPYCGLVDAGKDAGIRPDEKHIVNCVARKPNPAPKFTGTFKGQIAPRSVLVPVRHVIPFPELDEQGRPTGEMRFACSYRWKSCESYDWVWTGLKWRTRSAPKLKL